MAANAVANRRVRRACFIKRRVASGCGRLDVEIFFRLGDPGGLRICAPSKAVEDFEAGRRLADQHGTVVAKDGLPDIDPGLLVA